MIHQVSGLDDPRVADYTHVGDAAWIRARGLFVAEGRLVVTRLLESGAFPVRSVLVTPSAAAALGPVLDAAACDVYVCPQQMMNSLTGFNFHRGCLALAERPAPLDTLERFVAARRVLALEGVGNPDNVGGLFRVAAAFGVGGVLLDGRSADPLYRKSIRTSMGAALQIPFARRQSWLADLAELRGKGFHLVALTPAGSAMALRDYAAVLPHGQRLVLMLGAEGPGLSRAAFGEADAVVRVPIAAGVDSLNVVVAAGIALSALDR